MTADEAIAQAILVVEKEFPDATIRRVDARKSHGSFRTYDVNGVKALLSVKGGKVRVRSAHSWVSLPEYVADLAARFEADRKRKKRLEAERKAKAACKLQEEIDIQLENKQMRYRALKDAYERERKKAAQLQRKVDTAVNKEHWNVEALQEELRQIRIIQQAARARRHELLDAMEEKNSDLLGRIASAQEQVHKEEVSGLVFNGMSSGQEKKAAAVKARKEYEALKERIDADAATGNALDVDALLQQYEYEAAAVIQTSLRNGTPADAAAAGTVHDDDIERQVQDAKREQSNVRAAEDGLDALFDSVDALKAVRP